MNAAVSSWTVAVEQALRAAAVEGVRHKVRRSRFSPMWIVAALPGQAVDSSRVDVWDVK